MALSASTRSAVDHLPAEATTVRKVYAALKAAGTPVTTVWDGEANIDVSNVDQTLEAVFAVDQAWLKTESGSWVFVVLGNGWDALTDYTTDLEEALAPVNDYLMAKG